MVSKDLELLQKVYDEVQPEIVIQMASEPIIRESYKNLIYTYDINGMETVNVLEGVRNTPSVKSFVNVTKDKEYLNNEWKKWLCINRVNEYDGDPHETNFQLKVFHTKENF